jgi:hypothetical protein
MNDEKLMIWKKEIIVQSWNLVGETEENHINFLLGYLIPEF